MSELTSQGALALTLVCLVPRHSRVPAVFLPTIKEPDLRPETGMAFVALHRKHSNRDWGHRLSREEVSGDTVISFRLGRCPPLPVPSPAAAMVSGALAPVRAMRGAY